MTGVQTCALPICAVVLGASSNETLAAFSQQATDRGLSVTALDDTRTDEANDAALRWITHAEHRLAAASGLYLCAQEGIVDALSVAPLAASDNGLVLTVNHNDMESMVRAIDIIERHPGNLERITFLGGNMCFNLIDKMIVERALANRSA